VGRALVGAAAPEVIGSGVASAMGESMRLDRLEGTSVRLTYRTMCALRVIAAKPGLSNSEISERIGISDQGQISKLLARLARNDLIENTGKGWPRGTSNAWRLTPAGRQLEHRIRASLSLHASEN
jgi:DNA-binding MarR family transcriptional regulator